MIDDDLVELTEDDIYLASLHDPEWLALGYQAGDRVRAEIPAMLRRKQFLAEERFAAARADTDRKAVQAEQAAKGAVRYVTKSQLLAAIKMVADKTGEVVSEIRQRFEVIEARLAECEQGRLEFRGVHQKALAYPRGSAVSHAGSLWIAIRDVSQGEEPGKSDGFQLAVKRGADGKDKR